MRYAAALCVALVACHGTTPQSATVAAGQVCELVLTPMDAPLGPLCTTVADLALAIETLMSTPQTDGGRSTGLMRPVAPTDSQIYGWLVVNGKGRPIP